jgi:hypothetical protein
MQAEYMQAEYKQAKYKKTEYMQAEYMQAEYMVHPPKPVKMRHRPPNRRWTVGL